MNKTLIKNIIAAIENMDYSNYLLDSWTWDNTTDSRLRAIMVENMYDSYCYYNNNIYIKNIVFDLSKNGISCIIEFSSKNDKITDTEYTVKNILKSSSNKPLYDLFFNVLYDNKSFGKNLVPESAVNVFKIELVNQM